MDVEVDDDNNDDDLGYDYGNDLYFQEDYRRLVEKLAARFNQALPAA